ncbi:MAG: hypothetical protein FWE25_03730 [Lachnospiraceae bacterium]|nr:hypothetical protein [Lachnospiraceae bacterium]
MKCPVCEHELEILKKQTAINRNGDPVMSKYAVCRDCKKQWNLSNKNTKNNPVSKPSTNTEKKSTSGTTQKTGRPSTHNKANSRLNSSSSRSKPSPRSHSGSSRPTSSHRPSNPGRGKQRLGSQAKSSPPAHLAERKKKTSAPQVKEQEKVFFRIPRIILAIFSIAASGFVIYAGIENGMTRIQEGTPISIIQGNSLQVLAFFIAYIYLITSACFFITGIILLITQKNNGKVAFSLPIVLYLIGAISAFVGRDDHLMLSAGIIAVIFGLGLAILLFLKTRAEENAFYDD